MVYESLYASTHKDRVGPSCPIAFFINQYEYRAHVIGTDVNNRPYTVWMHNPGNYTPVTVMEAGQYCDYLPAAISA